MPLNASSTVRHSVSLVAPVIAEATAGLLERPKKFLDGLWVRNAATASAVDAQSTKAEDVVALRETVAALEKRCQDPDTDEDARTAMLDQIHAFRREIARHEAPQRPSLTAVANAGAGMIKERCLAVRSRLTPVPIPADQTLSLMPVQAASPVDAHHDIPSVMTSFATLFRSASEAVSTRVTGLSQAIERSTEHRKQVNAAPQPPLRTDLEKLCGSPRTGSPLAQWLSASRSDKIVRLRSKEGAESNPNAGRYGAAALAVMSGHPSRLKALLKSSAGAIELDRVSEVFNKTALGIAIEKKDEVSIQLLLEAGAHVMTDDLAMLARRGDLALFHRLHHHAKAHPAPGGIDLAPALGEAVVADHLAIARHVLESGVHLSQAHTSLLGLAAAKGHTEMVALLQHHAPAAYLRAASAVAPSEHPLMLAILGAHRATVATLLPLQTNRSFVEMVHDGLAVSLRRASPYDQQRFALIAEDLRAWLAEPTVAICAGTAPPSSGAVTAEVVALAADTTDTTASPVPRTRKVFAPSLPFKSVMHGMV